MAEEQAKGNDDDLKLLAKTKISVFVDEVLPDILMVTYESGVKIFKGVLLDSTKRNLPYGVPTLHPAFNIPTKNPDDDPLYSVNQRFAYLDSNAPKKKNMQISSKYRNSKMTVRLRPRQVLCSKCKGICNENSENVSRKRKSSDGTFSPPIPAPKRSSNAPVTRSVNILSNVTSGNGNNSNSNTRRSLRAKEPSAIVPRINKISYQESSSEETSVDSESNQKGTENLAEKDLLDPETMQLPPVKLKKMLKKKRNLGCSEEIWEDMSIKDQMNKVQSPQSSQGASSSTEVNTTTTLTTAITTATTTTTTNTRTIKISYGPQGEGTVLKIPAQINDDKGNDSEENVDRAARRALKRAKKEARRKVLLSNSPLYLSSNSPRYHLGSGSPRHNIGSSPRHGLAGNNSPRYSVMTYELNLPRRRKHKVKHKKKHKEDKDRKHKEGEVSSTQEDSKEECTNQKVSINLKKLNNTYTTSDKTDYMSSSDEHAETVPNFPSTNSPLMLRLNAQTVTSALGADGGRLLVGDVVWGKIHGFPWWPGKILTLTNCGSQGTQAHVAWYASSTSSVLQCDQLSNYLDNFKIRYNKKKKGPYKEAVRQATTEARENAENRVRQPLGNSPSHNIMQVVPPALASPREIDVVS